MEAFQAEVISLLKDHGLRSLSVLGGNGKRPPGLAGAQPPANSWCAYKA